MATLENNVDKFPRKFGKYHLLGPLAQGGMGALYLAVTGDRGLERMMVIKTVLPHLADAEYLARFRDEAKVVVKLSHGNLIPVFDAGQVDGELFLAMDFVEGRDLRAVWNRCAKKQVAFPIDVAVYIIKELCRGLHYAHSFRDLELVHRDISPPNVLVSYAGEVKLTDFGLASSTMKLEKTAPGIIYGKVAYMSPEQARGEKLDARSDLYAAGIVLWELLTGRQLFPPGKDQPQELISRARNPDVLSPSKRAPRVPSDLDAIVLRALSPERDERYSSCEEFRQGLSSWLATHAPTTDAARISKFLNDLFAEDIESDRERMEELVRSVRRRVQTLPPTDELRQLVERSGAEINPNDISPPVRSPGSVGRRLTDQEAIDAADRRNAGDRRNAVRTKMGVAVSVPAPSRDGRTVITPPAGTGVGAATALATDLYESADLVDLIGQILDGRYRIDELIGEGGMGKVYMAEHVDIGKRVAVKVLHPVYGRMPDLVERFRREARAASRIGHPHIVDVTDSGTTADGSVYFVMEYLDGVELGSIIDREGALDIARSLKIATQICRALSAAHAQKIIHRDLKPENVFLTMRDGRADFVKVLDFGIAKSTEAEQARDKRLTSPGMAMGTPEYMAPEQAAGRPADERCDVYALGAILYEMMTGAPPYQGENFMEILTKKATLDPVPAKTLRPELPEEVNALVVRAMSRDPDDRPASMEAFEYEITKCLSGRGIAVAQMLGMSTDANLLASLNPGLSVRNADTGVVRRSTTKPPPMGTPPDPTVGTASPASGNPVRLDTPAPVASGPIDLAFDSFDDQTQTVRGFQEQSKLGGFGWTMVLLFVLGAGAVVAFIAFGERGGGRGQQLPVGAAQAMALAGDASVADPTNSASANVFLTDAGTPAIEADADGGETDGGAAAPAVVVDDGAATKKNDPKASDRNGGKKPVGKNAIPRTDGEAGDLLKLARAATSKLNWDEARALYERVAQSKYRRADAYLGMAKVAFESRDTDGAIDYATRALKAGAGDSAEMLLGHAYYKKGRYQEALDHYESVLKRSPSNKEAQRAVSEARRKLNR